MADAKQTEPQWKLAAEVLAETAEQKLTAMREAAQQTQQALEELVTMYESLLNTATEKLKRVKQDREAREMAEERARTGTPVKRPAKKRTTKA
jgi:hypothetical protein